MLSISSWPIPLPTDLPVPIQKFSTNRATLAYRESGAQSANHVLIWIHGLPLDSRFWTAQYERFSSSGSYRNIFVDLRGYGTSSSKLPTDIDLDVTQLYCDDLLALLDHLQIKSASLIGFASAAHVALRFSAQNPNRARSLVLMNGSPRFKVDETSRDYNFGFPPIVLEKFRSASREGIEQLADMVLDPTTVFQDLSAEDALKVGSWMREMAHDAGIETLRGFFEGIVNDDDRHLIPKIMAPALLLASSLGKEVPTQTGLYLRKRLRNALLVEIPDADHFFPVTRPAIVNELIDGFLVTV